MLIESNITLKPYNTLQIPAIAKYFVTIKNESDIIELMQTDLRKEEKHYILN
jgi:UDP-N-acetylenolpyruvoylglucosamine reductase